MGAIQACARGEALPHQQREAIDFIRKIAYNGGAIYFPGEEGRRDTDFALGRAWVGQQLTSIINLKVKRGGTENG